MADMTPDSAIAPDGFRIRRETPGSESAEPAWHVIRKAVFDVEESNPGVYIRLLSVDTNTYTWGWQPVTTTGTRGYQPPSETDNNTTVNATTDPSAPLTLDLTFVFARTSTARGEGYKDTYPGANLYPVFEGDMNLAHFAERFSDETFPRLGSGGESGRYRARNGMIPFSDLPDGTMVRALTACLSLASPLYTAGLLDQLSKAKEVYTAGPEEVKLSDGTKGSLRAIVKLPVQSDYPPTLFRGDEPGEVDSQKVVVACQISFDSRSPSGVQRR